MEANTIEERDTMTQDSSPSPTGGQLVAKTQGGGQESGPLKTEHGSTKVADIVVSKVAGIATREVEGVHAVGGTAARAVGSLTQRVGLSDERTQGVSVEVGEREAAVDLIVVVEYGASIPTVTTEIRENVIRRIEGMVGLSVTEVNIAVNDLYFPGDDDQREPEAPRVA